MITWQPMLVSEKNATPYNTQKSMHCLENGCADKIINREPWSSCLSDPDPSKFNLWGMLIDKLHGNYPHNNHTLKEIILNVVFSI